MQQYSLKILFLLVFVTFCSCVLATSGQASRFVDNAEILSSSERRNINSKLDRIARDYEIDLFIVTLKNERDAQSPNLRRFAQDYFRNNRQLSGSNGAVLALSMNPRKYEIETFGRTRTRHDSARNRFVQGVESRLRLDNYNAAFNYFADQMIPPEAQPFIYRLLSAAFSGPSLLIPFFLTLIITVFLAWNHKGSITVGSNTYANPGAFKLTFHEDKFVETTVRKSRINRGGSRRSGGGRSGGGGGSF